MEDQITEARRHAVTASQLLANLETFAQDMSNLTPDQRLQLIATGRLARLNESQEWTKDLAVAHALAALALAMTGDAKSVEFAEEASPPGP